MSIFKKLKKRTGGLAEEHGDKVEGAIDTSAEFIDDKSGGNYTDQIDAGAEKAKDLVEGLSDDE